MPNLRCVFSEDDIRDDESHAPDDGPGGLLRALEQRQNDVLAQLDRLNAQVEAVLVGLGVRLDDPVAEVEEVDSED